MSAVLAITDRRSALFQILFAVFDSLEGFVIVMVHCILRREVSEPYPIPESVSKFKGRLSNFRCKWKYSHMIFTIDQVQEAVKCRVVDRQEDGNGDSGGSFQNGHAQLMVNYISVFLLHIKHKIVD